MVTLSRILTPKLRGSALCNAHKRISMSPMDESRIYERGILNVDNILQCFIHSFHCAICRHQVLNNSLCPRSSEAFLGEGMII